MGLGGYLFWTAAAREINQRTGLKCLPVEAYGNGVIKIIKSEIFKNNPHIEQFNVDTSVTVLPIQLNNPTANYCKQDTPEKAVHRYDKHVIEQICEVYGISDPILKCDLFLTEEEKLFSKKFHDKMGQRYITIEPNTKDEYTLNKRYPHEKWQEIVNDLHHKIKIVQMDNVIDMTGKTNFREAASLISRSEFHVGCEGGLMHAANALDKKCVILLTGFLHPTMTCYPENSNIWIGKDHGPCGMKVLCDKCESEGKKHDPREITNEIIKLLEKGNK